jgi:ribonuclease-3
MNNSDLNQWIQTYMGVLPQDMHHYKMALTTRQYEALEFLGDSIIGFVVSEYLVKCFVSQPGLLTDIKAKIVNNSNLAQKAREIALSSVVSIPNTSSQEQITDSVVADMLEALIGAVYQDQGLDRCRDVISKILNLEDISLDEYIQKQLDSENIDLENKNPISTLQELLAKYGISPPEYSNGVIIGGVPHCPVWSIEAICRIGSEILSSEGGGSNKRKAREEAAQKLYPLAVKSTQKLRIVSRCQ